jgi:hypothetical protein
MHLRLTRHWPVFLSACLFVAGCGEKTPDKDADGVPNQVEAEGVKTVDAAKLPKLADPLPPLDGGRLENVAPPEGWQRQLRDARYLALFLPESADISTLPRIVLTVADVGEGVPATVTAENLEEFRDIVAKELETRGSLDEPAKAMLIGENPYVRYVVKGKMKTLDTRRQILETTFDGRRYTLTLDVIFEINKGPRDLAYAVAAGIRFKKP